MKQLLFITFICLTAYVGHSQTGKVGVNTTDPKATLDVQSKSDNTTADVEGLLVPRVNKEKAYKMATATTKPDTSNMVYINDLTATTAPADTTIADVTEKGYYYWNGGKWVMLVGDNGAEWVHENDTIKLKRSFGTPNSNKVFYNKEGARISAEFGMIRQPDGSVNFSKNNLTFSYFHPYNAVTKSTETLNSSSNTNIQKYLNYEFLLLNSSNNTNNEYVVRGNSVETGQSTASTNVKRFTNYGSSINHVGPATIKSIYNNHSGVRLGNDAKSDYVVNSRGYLFNATSQVIPKIFNRDDYISLREGSETTIVGSHNSWIKLDSAATAGSIKGIRASITMDKNSTASDVFGFQSTFNFNTGSVIDRAFGIHLQNAFSENPTLNRMYGLYVQNIDKGSIDNYAIYTNKGKNSLGDTLQVRNLTNTIGDSTDCVVVADSTGTLRTMDPKNMAGLWQKNTSDNGIYVDYANIKDSIQYRVDGYRIFDKTKAETKSYTVTSQSYESTPVDSVSSYNFEQVLFENVKDKGAWTNGKQFRAIATSGDTTSGRRTLAYNINNTVNSDNATDYTSVTGLRASASYNGTGKTDFIRGLYSIATQSPQSRVRTLMGTFNVAHNLASYDTTHLVNGALNLAILRGTGKVNIARGVVNQVGIGDQYSLSNKIGDVNQVLVGHNFLELDTTASVAIDEAYGQRIDFSRKNPSSTIGKQYGLFINNVNIGAETYSIYTKEGKVYLQDSVGIGTTTPGEKLEVNGNVKATTFIAGTGATFPDYVFEKYYTGASKLKADYDFKSLSEVERFVKKNGHLPGYKSAQEVAKDGSFDMTATQLTNVEKIEELYLHTLEQEKKIEAQHSRIESQQEALKSRDAKIKSLEERLARIEKLLSDK